MKKKPKTTSEKKFWPGEPQNPFKGFQPQKSGNQSQARSPMGRRSSRGR